MNDMVNMSHFVEAKSDQLNADDLIGREMTITVTRVTGNDGDQPVSIFYEGDKGKPFKPCKTIRRVLLAIWGQYAQDYVGRSMTLYRDDKVTFGGLETGGIRIRAMSHLDEERTVVVMKTKGKKAGIKIMPLRIEQPTPNAGPSDAEWTEQYIARLKRQATAEKLEQFVASRKNDVETLPEEFAAQCDDAYAQRAHELAGPQGGGDGFGGEA